MPIFHWTVLVLGVHLSSEITCKKYILDDGACEHVFHHRALGELGGIRIEDRSERTHIGGLVTGCTEDLLHAQRDALFRPLMEEFARADNRSCFQGKHMPCERCGTIAASLIFINGTERCDFEDCARLMYPEYSRGTAPVWIIGPPVRSGPEPERAADILEVWPKREPMRRMRQAQFNPICDTFLARAVLLRLMEEGLDRHEAVHAIGSVLSEQLFAALREDGGADLKCAVCGET